MNERMNEWKKNDTVVVRVLCMFICMGSLTWPCVRDPQVEPQLLMLCESQPNMGSI